MKNKLDKGLYNDPWEFVDDMWLMFNNAWLYNRKTSKVYKFCTKVRDKIYPTFVEQILLHLCAFTALLPLCKLGLSC